MEIFDVKPVVSRVRTTVFTASYALAAVSCMIVAPLDERSAEPPLSEAGKESESSVSEASTPSPMCSEYCDKMQNCTGDGKQYLDLEQCRKVCALFPPGIIGGSDGNSAACRMKYANKAFYSLGTKRDSYCLKAGPGSDGTCGSVCDGFCTLMMLTCTTAKSAPYFYSSPDACLSVCRGLRDNPPYTVSNGTLPDRNDAQCRLFHVTTAVTDSDEHCKHSMGVTMCDGKVEGGM